MREFVINEAQIVEVAHCNANWDVKLPVTSVTVHGERLPEVVRCCDCMYYELIPEDSGDWCGYWTDRVYRADGYCAWAERRAE